MFDDGMPYEDPNKGWNRASIQYRSRKLSKPDVRLEDLLMPSGFGNLRMFGMCVGMGLMMTVLYLWCTVFIVNIFVPLTGVAYAALLGSGVVGFSLFLYGFGTRETRRDRELAARL